MMGAKRTTLWGIRQVTAMVVLGLVTVQATLGAMPRGSRSGGGRSVSASRPVPALPATQPALPPAGPTAPAPAGSGKKLLRRVVPPLVSVPVVPVPEPLVTASPVRSALPATLQPGGSPTTIGMVGRVQPTGAAPLLPTLPAPGGEVKPAAGKTSNQAPVVDAGPDQTVAFAVTPTVGLAGSAVDDGLPEGSSLIYAWSKVSGPGTVTFNNPGLPAATATFSVAGRYVLRLAVTDTELTGTDEVVVVLTGTNQPPQVNAGPDLVVVQPNAGTLLGTVTDDGLPNNQVTLAWSVRSAPNGGAVAFATPDQARTTATFSLPGTYVVRLTADDSAATAFDEAQVQVVPAVSAPVAEFTVDATTADHVISFPVEGNVALNQSPTLFSNGGRVVAASSFLGQSVPERLLDYADDIWETSDIFNQWVLIEPAGGPVRLNGVQLRTSAVGAGVKGFEIWVSATTTDPAAFVRVLAAEAANLDAVQSFAFPGGATLVRYLKYVPLTNQGGDATFWTRSLVGIPVEGNGVVQATSGTAELALDEAEDTGQTTAWTTQGAANEAVTLALAGNRSQRLYGVRVTAGVNGGPKDIEVQISTTTPDTGAFTTVASTTLGNQTLPQTVLLPDLPVAKYVRLLWKTGYGSRIEVLQLKVLAVPENGAALLGYTSPAPGLNPGGSPVTALDVDTQNDNWQTASGQNANQSFTLLLPEGGLWDINRIALKGGGGATSPKDFELLVSTTTGVDDQFRSVFAGTLNQGPRQVFDFPTSQARYVRLLLKNTYGSPQMMLEQCQVYSPQWGTTTARFVDRSTDIGGGIVSRLWEFGDGQTETVANPVHTYAQPGTYRVRLTVTDTDGLQTIVERNYRARAPYQVDFTASPVSLGEQQTLVVRDSSAEPLGETFRRQWDFGDGGGAGVANGRHNQRSYRDNGTYPVTLTVGSGSGFTYSVTKPVAVENRPPTVTLGDDRTVVWGEPWSVSGTVGDPSPVDFTSLVCRWEYGDGTQSAALTGCTTANCCPPHPYAQPGIYSAQLTVTDKDGGSTSATTTVVVRKRPVKLEFVAVGGSAGVPPQLRARLTDAFANQPLAGKTIFFRVNGTGIAGVTDAQGEASASLPVPQGSTSVQVSVRFAGDALYRDNVLFAGDPPPPGDGTATHRGTDFWLMFLYPGSDSADLSLWITSEVEAGGQVTFPGREAPETFHVKPGEVARVRVPGALAATAVDGVENKAIHVTASAPVAVYGQSYQTFSTDTYLALPSTQLGTAYRVNTFLGSSQTGTQGRAQEIGVTATADNTKVTITPTVTVPPTAQPDRPQRMANQSYQITLNRGQVYSLIQSSDTQDLTGTSITASQPIAVFSGHLATALERSSPTDHLEEQEWPVGDWGREFVTVPFQGRTLGDRFQIVAAADDTHVVINGLPVATLAQGGSWSAVLQGPQHILTDKPVSVVQACTSLGHTDANPQYGDPLTLFVQPTNRYLATYTVAAMKAPGQGVSRQFLNLMVPTAVVGQVLLDGTLLPAARFTPAGTSGYAVAQLDVSPGAHRLTGPQPFGVMVYGLDGAEGQGNPGGLQTGVEESPETVTLTPKTGTQPVGNQACLTATVLDATTFQPKAGVVVTFTVTGPHARTQNLTTGADGTAQLCYSGTAAGIDTVRATVGSAFDTATALWSGGANQPPVVEAGPDRTAVLGANLLQNPGNDANLTGGEIPGWVKVSGQWSQADAGHNSFPLPQRGVSYFYPGVTIQGELQQTVDVSDWTAGIMAGVQQFEVRGWVRTATESNPGTPRILVECLSPGNQVLTTVTLPGTAVASLWSETVATFTPPVGTVRLRVRLLATASNGLFPNRAYFDSLSLRAVTGVGTQLQGSVTDDGQPTGTLTTAWTVENAPGGGTVAFAAASQPVTVATLSTAGSYTLRLTGNDGVASAFDTMTVTVTAATCGVTMTTGNLPNGTLGQAYSQPLTATGGTAPYGFTLVSGSLPPGLTVNPNGELGGTPLQAGDFTFTVDGTDATGCSAQQTLQLTIAPLACPPITLAPATLPDFSLAVGSYSQTFTVTGLSQPVFSVVSGTLPPGLSLSNSGVLSGFPTLAGTFTFILKVADGNQPACFYTQSYSLRLLCYTPDIGPAIPDPVRLPLGGNYSLQLVLNNFSGRPPVTYTVVDGSLPPGLTLTPAGLISGTVTTEGNFSVTVLATDVAGCSGKRAIRFLVFGANQPPVVDTKADKTITYEPNLVVNGGGEAALVQGRIPGWQPATGQSDWQSVAGGANGYPAAAEGTQFLAPGTTANAELFQDVDVSGFAANFTGTASTQQFRISGRVRTKAEPQSDTAKIRVELLDAEKQNLLGFFETVPISISESWAVVSQTIQATTATRWVRIRLLGTQRTGPETDTWFDDLRLEPVGVAGVRIDGIVTDDGLPNNTLTVQWSKTSGPGNVTFTPANQPGTAVTFDRTGVYVLRLTANDSQLTAFDEVQIVVTGPNRAPVVNAGPDQQIALPAQATLTGTVSDDGQPNPTPALSWSVTSAPNGGTVTFGSPANATTTATFNVAGGYVLRLTADDGAAQSFDEVTVSVSDGTNQPPVVNAGADQVTTASVPLQLSGSATDDGLPNPTLQLLWSTITAPPGGSVSFGSPAQAVTSANFTTPGVYVLRLTATDGALQASDDVQVTVVGVAIATPADGADITTQTPVTGTAVGGAWRLEYALNGDEEANPNPVWTQFASGAGAVVNGNLGVFDPTILLNGSYLIRLTVVVGTSEFSDLVGVTVTRNKKIGNFTVSFSDVSVPVLGIPIEVVRTYDSRDRNRKGDFGQGWTLSVKNIRVEKTAAAGKYWQETVSGVFPNPPRYQLQGTRAATVSLTFPNGQVQRFRPVFTPASSLAAIQYVNISYQPADARTHGTLVPLRDNGTEYNNPNGLVMGAAPDWPNSNPGGVNSNLIEIHDLTTLQVFNPTVFRYTDDSGVVYLLDQQTGLRSVTDLNGNTLTFTANGIIHSAGKSVIFTRDAQNRITAVTDPLGNQVIYTYDANGDLATVTDRESRTTTFLYQGTTHYLERILDPRGIQPIRNEYDADGRLTKHVDAFGKEIVYTHNLAGNTEVVTDRTGRPTTYSYDDRGNVLRKITADGAQWDYSYDDRDNQLTEKNPLGKVTLSTYDAADNKRTETDALGNTTTWDYNARRQVTYTRDPNGGETRNDYDPRNGNLLQTRDAMGYVTKYDYTPTGGLVSKVTDANNRETRYGYDTAGNVTSETDALGQSTTSTYDLNGNRKSSTVTRTVNGSPQTITTSYDYDRQNRLTKSTYADGTTTETVYNAIGKVEISRDQQGRETRYSYDDMGQLTQTTHPDGKFERATYDPEGRRLTSTDRQNRTTTSEYDAVGRLKKTIYPDTTFTETTYDLLGRVNTTKDALGHVTTYAYDPNCGCSGRRTKVIDALLHETNFTFDPNGNQQTMTDANGHTTTFAYDLNNRRTKTTFHDGTFRLTGYDSLGRRSTETDQAGRVTRFGYDDVGRLISVTDADNQTTRYVYNEIGQQTQQIDALGRTTKYEYDTLGRRTKRILPLNQFETYTYNPNGTLASRTDFNGKTTTYGYDNLNRLLSKTFDASFNQTPVTYTYTVSGRRETMTDGSGTTTWVYDPLRDWLLETRTPQGTLFYSYDAAGNLKTARSSNANGTSTDFGYDGLNRMISVTDNRLGTTQNVTNYTFDDVGNLNTVTLPNGVTTSYSYDSLNRLTSLAARLGTTDIAGYTYTLGAAGNREAVTELGGRKAVYTYDALYRLKSETISGALQSQNGLISYSYDVVGNRRSRQSSVAAVPSQASVQVDQNDRLTTDGYDNNGSTTTANGKTYVYDAEARLVSVTGGGTSVSIVYDGDGNRVAKTVTTGANSVTTKYLVDTNNHTGYAQVFEELQNGAVVRQYTFGHDLLSQRQMLAGVPTVHFYGYDGHGSVRYLTDAAGTKTDTYDYDAFGILIGQTGTTPNLYLYAGEQWDPDFSLYFNRARYLNVGTGRFWSMDDFEGDPDSPFSIHKYVYAGANPANNLDPSGNFSLIETNIVAAIQNTLTNIETNIGLGITDQIQYGGYSGFTGFGTEVALAVIPFVARALIREIAKVVSTIGSAIVTKYRQWAALRRVNQALRLAGSEFPRLRKLGPYFYDCLEISKDLIIHLGEGDLVELFPNIKKDKFLPVRKEITDEKWRYHVAVRLRNGKVLDPRQGILYESVNHFVQDIIEDGNIVKVTIIKYPQSY